MPVNSELVLSIERANTDIAHTIFVPFPMSNRKPMETKKVFFALLMTGCSFCKLGTVREECSLSAVYLGQSQDITDIPVYLFFCFVLFCCWP